jgi:hypothetical protein
MSEKSEIDRRFAVSLSASGLTHLPITCYANDFTFIVGSRSYFWPWFLAGFLSPRLSRLRSTDSIIETRDAADYFEHFVSLCRGSTLIVEDSTRRLFQSICCELGNFELLHSISDLKEPKSNVTEVFEDLFVISESVFSSDFDEFVKNLISFCSSHFNELMESSMTQLTKLNLSLIEAIISRESLKLRNEDSLYFFIKDRIEENREFSKLLEPTMNVKSFA